MVIRKIIFFLSVGFLLYFIFDALFFDIERLMGIYFPKERNPSVFAAGSYFGSASVPQIIGFIVLELFAIATLIFFSIRRTKIWSYLFVIMAIPCLIHNLLLLFRIGYFKSIEFDKNILFSVIAIVAIFSVSLSTNGLLKFNFALNWKRVFSLLAGMALFSIVCYIVFIVLFEIK